MKLTLAPRTTAGKVLFGALILLALFRGFFWASTMPPWWAPDEDYHWDYVHYVSYEKAIPKPLVRFEAREWGAAISKGAQLRRTVERDRLISSDRPVLAKTTFDGVQFRRPSLRDGRPVLHPPLTHILLAPVDSVASASSVFSRAYLARIALVLIGIAGFWAIWAIGASLLRDEVLAAAAGALVAIQPMHSISMSSVGNDGLAMTVVPLAILAALPLLGPDVKQVRHRQLVLAGVMLGVAILTKTTLAVLGPALALNAVYAWWRQGIQWRDIFVRASVFGAAAAAIFAPWHIFLLVEHNSLVGFLAPADQLVSSVSTAANQAGGGILDVWGDARRWLLDTYGTTWSNRGGAGFFDHQLMYWVPLPIVTAAAAFVLIALLRRRLAGPMLRVLSVGAIALAAILIPSLGADLLRAADGGSFEFPFGRFFLPLYPIGVIGLCAALSAARPLVKRLLVGALVAFSTAHAMAAWWAMVGTHYERPGFTGVVESLRRAVITLPPVVSPWMLWISAAGIVGAAAVIIAGVSLESKFAPRNADEASGTEGPSRDLLHEGRSNP